ncbi:MAG: hypothetical protein ACYCZW_02735 [Minisyncoccota bacterium]
MDKLKSSKELHEKIIFSINKEEFGYAKTYFFISIITTFVSFFGLIFSIRYMIQEFYRSSFHSYLSLILSDPSVTILYWKELSISLIETLPIVGITISLITIYSLMVSVRVLVKNIKGIPVLSFNN